MLINTAIPALLLDRGLNRLEAAAALRDMATQEYWGVNAMEESSYVVKETLGATYFHAAEEELYYYIPLGKGLWLVADRTKKGIYIVNDEEMPATLANSLAEGKLGAILKHPALSGETPVGPITIEEGRTWIRIYPEERQVSIVMPATQWDMARAESRWKRLRRRQIVEAGANQGISPSVIRSAATRLLLAVLPATAAWLAMEDAILDHPLWIVGYVSIAVSWILLEARKRMQSIDNHLAPRLRDLRERRIAARRSKFLGEEPS